MAKRWLLSLALLCALLLQGVTGTFAMTDATPHGISASNRCASPDAALPGAPGADHHHCPDCLACFATVLTAVIFTANLCQFFPSRIAPILSVAALLSPAVGRRPPSRAPPAFS